MNKNIFIIQFFRGFAAILVVIHHATLISQEKFGKSFVSDIFSTGGVGVDFFFVLSGFILLFVHIKDIGKREKAKNFFIKRFIRVYPIYWVVTILCLPFFFLSASNSKSFDGDYLYIIKSLFLFPQEKLPLLSVGWTLTHEIYFYFLLGLCIYFWELKLIRTIVFIIVIGSFYKAFFDFSGHWDYKYRTYETFLDSNFYLSFLFSRFNIEFFLGCIAALIIYLLLSFSGKEILNGGKNNLSKLFSSFSNNVLSDKLIYLVLTITLLVLLVINPDFFLGVYKNKITLVIWYGLIVSLLIIVSVMMEFLSQYKPKKIFTFLGDSSYSIYLVHYPALFVISKIIFLTRIQNIFSYASVMYIIIMLSIFFACLFYIFVEKPLWFFLKKCFP